MKKERKYIVELDEHEYIQLLAILAYTGGKVDYPADYPQHETLRKTAYTYHEWLLDDE